MIVYLERAPEQRFRLQRRTELLLQLGQAFVSALDGKVAPRDHHANARMPHRREQQLRKMFECLPGLDLQHDSQ